MSIKMTKDMRWHKDEKVEDWVVRHLAESIAWKSFDKEYY